MLLQFWFCADSKQIWRARICCFCISNHPKTELFFRSTLSPPALPQSPVCPGQRPQVPLSCRRCCCCGDRLHVNFYKKRWRKTEYNTGAIISCDPFCRFTVTECIVGLFELPKQMDQKQAKVTSKSSDVVDWAASSVSSVEKKQKKQQQRDEFLEAFLQLQTQPRVVLYHNTALGSSRFSSLSNHD